MTIESELIVVGKVRSWKYFDGRVEIEFESASPEILKTPSTPLPRLKAASREPNRVIPKPGETVLCFFQWYGAPSSEMHIRDAICLSTARVSQSVGGHRIRDITLRVLDDPAEIVATVRKEIERVPPTSSVRYLSVYPFKLTTFPDDDRLLPLARKWVRSADPQARFSAAAVLAESGDPADMPLLYALLNDPFTADIPFLISPWSGHEYVIRQAVAKGLRDRGLAIPAVKMAEPRSDLYYPLPLLALCGTMLIPTVIFAAVRRHKARIEGRRPKWSNSLSACATFVSLLLAVVTCALWFRSLETADDIVWASGGRMVNVNSYRHLVFLEIANGWPKETPLVHLAIGPDRTFDRQHCFRLIYGCNSLSLEYALYHMNPIALCNVQTHSGVLAYPFSRRLEAAHHLPGFRMVVGYSLLLAVFLLWPALTLIMPASIRAHRNWRARRVMRKGVCLDCGYDLRMHAKGERCPECGREKGW